MSVFRIETVPFRKSEGRPGGCNHTYRFYKDDAPVYQAHIHPHCMKPSEFTSLDDSQSGNFILKPSRNLMPMTWLLADKESGNLIGSFKRKFLGNVSWIIRDASARETGRFINRFAPRFWLLRVGDFIFGSYVPDSYEIISSGVPAVIMEREERKPVSADTPKTGLKKWLGKFLIKRDWVIRECEGQEDSIDPRLLYAGVVLLERISRDLSAAD